MNKYNFEYLDNLKPHQREWAESQITKFKNSGFAVPHGLIKSEAEKVNRPIVIEVQKIAEEFQDDCHRSVENIISQTSSVNVQDATNVWFFTKLAELQKQINDLLPYVKAK